MVLLWEEVEKAINEQKFTKQMKEYQPLDKLANILTGINTCVALYRHQDGLFVAANAKASNIPTITKYDTECMLDYIQSLANSSNPVQNVLNTDKRLTFQSSQIYKLFKQIQKIIDNLNTLSTQDKILNGENEYNQGLKTLSEQFKTTLNTFKTTLNTLNDATTLAQVNNSFNTFNYSLITNFNALLQMNGYTNKTVFDIMVGPSRNLALNNVTEYITDKINKSKSFIADLQDILNFITNDNQPQLNNITWSITTVPEISEDSLKPSIIECDPAKKTFHAEHRLVKYLELNLGKYEVADIDTYIGITMHCCPLCYIILTKIWSQKESVCAGTHGNSHSVKDALIGLRLHEETTQKDIIKYLLPNLDVEGLDTVFVGGDDM